MKVNKKLLIWREYTIFSFFSQTIDVKKRSSVENFLWLSQEYPPYRAPKGYRAYSYAVPRSEEASTRHGPMLPVVISNHSSAISFSPREKTERVFVRFNSRCCSPRCCCDGRWTAVPCRSFRRGADQGLKGPTYEPIGQCGFLMQVEYIFSLYYVF